MLRSFRQPSSATAAAAGVRVAAPTLVALLVGALLFALPAPAQAAACPAAGGATPRPAAAPTGADLVVQGHGWGHSLGMSQYGAQGAALLGCDHGTILRTYYQGADLVTSSMSGRQVHLTLLTDGTRATVLAENGSIRWLDVTRSRSVTQPPGSTWQVVRTTSGHGVRDTSGTQVLWVPFGDELRAEEKGVVARVQTYRGASRVVDLRMRWDHTRFTSSSDGLDAVQVIASTSTAPAVNKYLWGLAEVPVTWPAEALKAQAVAGRTYLAGRLNTAGTAFVIGTTTAAQHYTGYSQEQEDAKYGSHWRAAVDATTNRVLMASGRLIDAVYSSSHGGRSEDSRYVWGNEASYLKSVDDSRWDGASSNPYRSWAKGFTHAQLADAFGIDRVTSITLGAPGSTARWAGATVKGVRAGSPVTLELEGWDLRQALGLRSPGVASLTWVAPGNPVVGDWDGDGRDDLGWYRGGAFSLRDADGTTRVIRFGRTTDLPVVGDWDGDGRDGIGVFRDGHWYLRNDLSEGPHDIHFAYGSRGHRPVVGTWPGASGVGIGVVIGNEWHLRHTPTGGRAQVVTAFGRAADRPVAGDWDGDGTTTPGVVRGNRWYLASTVVAPVTTHSLAFGSASYTPVPGDFDGNGSTTSAVVENGTWYWRNDLAGGYSTHSVTFVA